MAEGSKLSYSQRLLSDLDILHDEMEKISSLKMLLEFAFAGQESSFKYVIVKIREQIVALHGLLNKIESDCQENIEKATSLKELRDGAEKEQNEAQYFLEVLPNRSSAWGSCEFGEFERCDVRQRVNEAIRAEASELPEFPSDMPSTSTDFQEVPAEFGEFERCDVRQRVNEAKPAKASELPGLPSRILPVTPKDLEQVPAYMKGRITCDQINVVVKNLNKAIMTKYRIRNQALSSMNATDRTLYYRYMREESDNKEGGLFIVEDDIKLFTSMKMDKRFHQIVVILRHCQRLKEIRTSGTTRYVIC